jgi:plastocyanin
MDVPKWKPVVAAGALLLGQAFVLTTPAGAAAPITITADMPAAVPGGHNWGFNDFFPRRLRVPQGTTIQFLNEGFHTATLLPAGLSARADMRTNGIVTTDSDDTTPNVNGTSHSQFNVAAVMPIPTGCGTSATPCMFDGSSVVSSGVSFGPPSGPFVVKITAAPGGYAFHCRIHPGMTGKLNVVPANEPGTSPEEITRLVHDQVKALVRAGFKAEERAEDATRIRNPNGTSTWIMTAGTGSADGRVAVLEFLPENLRIKRGDKVAWRSPEPNEPHTVTFPGELFTDLVPLCEAGTTDVPATPLHQPPQSPFDFTCGGPPIEIELGGGNGVRHVTSPTTISDSGIVASSRLTRAFGLPSSATLHRWKVSFSGAEKGTYTYICQIHGAGMSGTITVR